MNSPIARADAPLWRLAPDGRFDPKTGAGGRLLRLGFGGGSGGTFLAAKHRPPPPFRRGNFVLGQVVERPDHSLLVVGGVGVSARAADGTRVGASRFAVAALTPDLVPERRFDGPPSSPRLRLRLLSRAATVSARQSGSSRR